MGKISLPERSSARKNRQSSQSQLWRFYMPLYPISSIFCSAWKQTLILSSFTVACLGSCMHERAPSSNFYSNHEPKIPVEDRNVSHMGSLALLPTTITTAVWHIVWIQNRFIKKMALPCTQQCISLLENTKCLSRERPSQQKLHSLQQQQRSFISPRAP